MPYAKCTVRNLLNSRTTTDIGHGARYIASLPYLIVSNMRYRCPMSRTPQLTLTRTRTQPLALSMLRCRRRCQCWLSVLSGRLTGLQAYTSRAASRSPWLLWRESMPLCTVHGARPAYKMIWARSASDYNEACQLSATETCAKFMLHTPLITARKCWRRAVSCSSGTMIHKIFQNHNRKIFANATDTYITNAASSLGSVGFSAPAPDPVPTSSICTRNLGSGF